MLGYDSFFEETDLERLTKKQLAGLIQGQIEHWPEKRFNPSKTTIKSMRDALLDHSNGFRKLAHPETDTPPTPFVSSEQARTAPPPPTVADSRLRSQTTVAIDPGLDVVDTPDHADPLVITIHLFIEDTRYGIVRKSAVDIPVQSCELREVFSESGGCEHQIPVRVVVSELQKTYSAIEGPAKLGCPHRLDPAYLEYFTSFSSAGQLEGSVTFQPTMLSLSASSSIFIRVDSIASSVSTSNFTPQMLTSTQDNLNNEHNNLENESEPAFRHSFEGVSESSSNRRLDQHRSRPTALSSTITWLAQEATLRSNYQHFVNSQHRVLQNSEIILVWKFASDFYDIYHRAKSNVGTRITKAAIQSSLNIGETWLSEALAGHRLVKIYGPGGSNSASAVIQELAADRSPPRGRRPLLQYLEKWEKDHPCMG